MNLEEYENQFEDVLSGVIEDYPYDSEEYRNFVKLNKARIRRWRKKGKLLPELQELIEGVDFKMQWVLITEPWCGDAAHSHAFIDKLAHLNGNISLHIQNRDSSSSEINKYLTNGSKSIPKLVVRDELGNDLFTWGPRPKEPQEMVMNHKLNISISDEEKSKELQRWYNKDKGVSMQNELLMLFKKCL